MSYDLSPASLLAWSVHVALLAGSGVILGWLFRRAWPRMILWQTVLAIALALALIEPFLEPVPRIRAEWINPRHLWTTLGAGALLRLLWLGAGLRRLRRLRLASSPIKNLPDSRPGIRWYASKRVPAAIVCGWWHPWIVLPSGVLYLPDAHREAIVRHVLLHVARGDWLMALGEEIVRALLWFHPAVWFAIAKVQRERERALDEEVTRESGTSGALRTFLPGSLQERWYRLSPGRTCF